MSIKERAVFHVADGLYFHRDEKGDVTVAKREISEDGKTQRMALSQKMDANAWASVVANMSKGGEWDGRIHAAIAFHESEGEVDIAGKSGIGVAV